MLLILFIYLIDDISSQTLSTCNWCKFVQYYPKQYNTSKLQLNHLNESIIIDGYLNDSAWIDVEFTNTSFVIIAISLYNNTINGYNIPNNYSTKVKLTWDNNYLYIGAISNEPFIYGTIIGHNNAISCVPYFDHDFEIFIDPSGTNYFYKEFEINSIFVEENSIFIEAFKSLLSQITNIYPTLLGIYQWSDYWEWTWQSVGITKYMHYPQYWGMLQFYTDKSQICLNIE